MSLRRIRRSFPNEGRLTPFLKTQKKIRNKSAFVIQKCNHNNRQSLMCKMFKDNRYYQLKQSGAEEACWAHNPEVRGSKPRSANFLFFIFFSFLLFLVFFFFFFFFFSGPNGPCNAMPIGLTINNTHKHTHKNTLHAEGRVLEHVKSHRGNEPRLPLRPPSAMRPRWENDE